MKNKLKLKDLSVKSFVTTVDEMSHIKGASGTVCNVTELPGCNTNFNCFHTTNETEITNCICHGI